MELVGKAFKESLTIQQQQVKIMLALACNAKLQAGFKSKN